MSLAEQMFSFEGRLRRRDFWISSIVLWIAVFAVSSCVLGLLAVHLGLTSASQPVDAPALVTGGIISVLVLLAIGFIALWPALAIGMKRCHDRDKSGWWLLVWYALTMIPFLGIFALAWQVIELGFIDGTQGSNRFGPSPKGIGADAARLGRVFE